MRKYIHIVKSKGKRYGYYRRNGKSFKISGQIGSAEFHRNYLAIHESFEPTIEAREMPGSFEHACQLYFKSPEFYQLADSSKVVYRRVIDALRKQFGRAQVSQITRANIFEIRDGNPEQPSKANTYVMTMRLLLQFAVNRGFVKYNVANEIEKLKTGDGYQPWSEADLKRAEGLTGSCRIAFYLALWTGQRKSDILKMKWSDIRDGVIFVIQKKTKVELFIPIHPVLAEVLEAEKLRTKGFTIIQKRNGQEYKSNAFDTGWRYQKKKLGIQGVFHGLRKSNVVALFESGCTPQEVQSISGHADLKMVQHYGEGASQKLLAKSAMSKLTENDS